MVILIAMAVLALGVLVGFALLREAWMDELFTYVYTDPAKSAGEHFRTQWANEPHPATYYFLVWAWRSLAASQTGIFWLRLLSIGLSAGLFVGALGAYRALIGGRVVVFAAFLLTSPVLLFYGQEARSYFFSFFGGVYLGIVFLSAVRPAPLQWRSLWITGLAGVILCTVHFISSFTAIFFILCLGMIALYRRRWDIVIFAGVLVTLALVCVGSNILFSSGLRNATSSFWIGGSDVLQSIVWMPAFIGLPMIAIVAGVLASPALRAHLKTEQALTPAFYALGAVFLFVAFAYGVCVVKPFIVLRYLCTWVGFFLVPAVFVATYALEALKLDGASALAMLIGTSFVGDTLLMSVTPHTTGPWREAGLFVQGIPACRDATIPFTVLSFVPKGNDLEAYSRMFAWHAGGDPHRFVGAEPASLDRAAAQSCPIRLWAANMRPQYLEPEVKDAFERTCAHEPISVLSYERGYLFVPSSDVQTIAEWKGAQSSCAEALTPKGLLDVLR